MSDFERSGMMFDEPARRRSPGTWFADLGDRLARGFNNLDRPTMEEDEADWEEYEDDEPGQATAVAGWDPIDPDPEPVPSSGHKRFPAALHGYDREAVDAHLAELEHELAELRIRRTPAASVQAEIDRVGEETSAILKVAHQQASEITRRAQSEADRCVSDAAANAVSMTEDAKRKLRQLDSETDAVWAERGRLIEDVRNVATSLFSLAEDAADRFPEEGDRRGTAPAPVVAAAPTRTASPPPQAAVAPAPAPVSAPPQTAARPPQAPVRPPHAAAPPPVAATPRPHTAAGQPRPAGAPALRHHQDSDN